MLWARSLSSVRIDPLRPGPAVGDTVRLVPGYAPTTVNLHDCFFVVEGDVVTDVRPVQGRYGARTAVISPS